MNDIGSNFFDMITDFEIDKLQCNNHYRIMTSLDYTIDFEYIESRDSYKIVIYGLTLEADELFELQRLETDLEGIITRIG